MKKSAIYIDGFTLMELLVVLLMVSILVSAGFLVTKMVRGNFNSIKEDQHNLIEIQKSDMQLNSLFFNSDSIRFSQENNTVSFKDESISIWDNQIISKENEVLFDSVYDIHFKFFMSKKKIRLIERLSFNLIHENVEIPFTYSKQYDIKTRLNFPLKDSLIIE